jgi:hypothetical protein
LIQARHAFSRYPANGAFAHSTTQQYNYVPRKFSLPTRRRHDVAPRPSPVYGQ